MLGLNALKLDGNLFTRDDVGTEVNVTKGTAANLTADAVFVTYAKILKKLACCNAMKVRAVL